MHMYVTKCVCVRCMWASLCLRFVYTTHIYITQYIRYMFAHVCHQVDMFHVGFFGVWVYMTHRHWTLIRVLHMCTCMHTCVTYVHKYITRWVCVCYMWASSGYTFCIDNTQITHIYTLHICTCVSPGGYVCVKFGLLQGICFACITHAYKAYIHIVHTWMCVAKWVCVCALCGLLRGIRFVHTTHR